MTNSYHAGNALEPNSTMPKRIFCAIVSILLVGNILVFVTLYYHHGSDISEKEYMDTVEARNSSVPMELAEPELISRDGNFNENGRFVGCIDEFESILQNNTWSLKENLRAKEYYYSIGQGVLKTKLLLTIHPEVTFKINKKDAIVTTKALIMTIQQTFNFEKEVTVNNPISSNKDDVTIKRINDGATCGWRAVYKHQEAPPSGKQKLVEYCEYHLRNKETDGNVSTILEISRTNNWEEDLKSCWFFKMT